jgi:hypothetical protein
MRREEGRDSEGEGEREQESQSRGKESALLPLCFDSLAGGGGKEEFVPSKSI